MFMKRPLCYCLCLIRLRLNLYIKGLDCDCSAFLTWDKNIFLFCNRLVSIHIRSLAFLDFKSHLLKASTEYLAFVWLIRHGWILLAPHLLYLLFGEAEWVFEASVLQALFLIISCNRLLVMDWIIVERTRWAKTPTFKCLIVLELRIFLNYLSSYAIGPEFLRVTCAQESIEG